jgi:hypothetical protein
MNRTDAARSVRQWQLTRRQEHALTALMKHGIIAQAARASNVPESTLRRWLRSDATFLRAYREMRRKVTEHANGMMQTAAGEAAAKLITLMRDKTLPASVQLSAAIQILDRSASSEIEERVTALEDRRADERDDSTERLRAV